MSLVQGIILAIGIGVSVEMLDFMRRGVRVDLPYLNGIIFTLVIAAFMNNWHC